MACLMGASHERSSTTSAPRTRALARHDDGGRVLIALTKWAIVHQGTDAQVTLPIGVVGAGELLNVLRALEKARISPSRAGGAQP